MCDGCMDAVHGEGERHGRSDQLGNERLLLQHRICRLQGAPLRRSQGKRFRVSFTPFLTDHPLYLY